MIKVKTECGVIGCKRYRTITAEEGQTTVFLCRSHWMGLPKVQRTEMNKAFRDCDARRTITSIKNVIALWDACVDQAIQNELGIAHSTPVGL